MFCKYKTIYAPTFFHYLHNFSKTYRLFLNFENIFLKTYSILFHTTNSRPFFNNSIIFAISAAIVALAIFDGIAAIVTLIVV